MIPQIPILGKEITEKHLTQSEQVLKALITTVKNHTIVTLPRGNTR
jgi:hypothetical protein